MEFVSRALPYIQIALSLLLIGSILLQQTGASIGETFGGSGDGAGFHTRRGAEKTLFRIAIVLGVLFAVSAILAVIVAS